LLLWLLLSLSLFGITTTIAIAVAIVGCSVGGNGKCTGMDQTDDREEEANDDDDGGEEHFRFSAIFRFSCPSRRD